MALYTSTSGVGGLLPSQYGDLVIQPVIAESVFAQIATTVLIDTTTYRVPIVTAFPNVSWVAEGAEIPISDPTLNELVITPTKVGGIDILSQELANDSRPEVAAIVGKGLAQQIALGLDQAAFAGVAAPAPAGLSTLSGIQTYVNASAYANLDFAAEAISKAETVGAKITAFVTNPTTALALAKIKEATGSNKPVLGSDPSQPTGRTILGVPLFVSQHVAANTLWAVDRSRLYLVIRQDVTIKRDESVYFTSDRVAIKATMRAGFGFVHAASVVKVTTA